MFLTNVPSTHDYFSILVGDDRHFPLLEVAVSLAQDEYPELDIQQVLADVDQLLARLHRRVAVDASPLQRLRSLNRFFYRDLGFVGNINDYHDPDNSHLNIVLRTRKGIPISLAVLWLELAHGIGLTASGVGFPGHFMVKVTLPEGQVVIDPFTGQSLSREELQERLEPYLQAQGLVGDFDVPLGLYLQACSGRDMIARMLRNLKEIHRTAEDWSRLLAVQERLVRLLPTHWEERRDRGLVFAELGMRRPAIDDLRAYLLHTDAPFDAISIKERLVELEQS